MSYETFREINEIYNTQSISVYAGFSCLIFNNFYYRYLVSKDFLSYSVSAGIRLANFRSCLAHGSTMSLMIFESSRVTYQVIRYLLLYSLMIIFFWWYVEFFVSSSEDRVRFPPEDLTYWPCVGISNVELEMQRIIR